MSDFDVESRNYIDGELCEASNGARFANVNPATEDVIGDVADGTKEDMDRAIGAARRAFDETDWATDVELRVRCLEQLNAALAEDKDLLRDAGVAESGAPVTFWRQVNDMYIDRMSYWSDLAKSYAYETAMSDIEFMGRPQRRILRREPVGVVGAITPWNVPLYLNLCKAGPALAAGNTVVLKPAPDTPWSGTHLGRLVAEKTDIPPGVFNVVTSSDHMVGAELSSDPRVDLVTFTGSTATGRRVMESAAETVKKVFLELGGKSATVVLDDADLAAVLPFCATVCTHGGQGCAIQTRLLIPRSRFDEAVGILEAAFQSWPYGDPTDPGKLQGPQVSRKQQERVLGYIDTARREGASVVCGGGVPDHLEKGFFVEPTLLVDVDPSSTVAQEEVFGPVLCVIPHDGDDDAVRIANDSIYGLSGGVHAGSEEHALAVARRIRTGTLSLNGAQWFDIDTPFGGYKQSGVGRENGVMGFEEYLETKVMALPRG